MSWRYHVGDGSVSGGCFSKRDELLTDCAQSAGKRGCRLQVTCVLSAFKLLKLQSEGIQPYADWLERDCSIG